MDFKKELTRYDLLAEGDESMVSDNETSVLLNTFHATIKRFSKEQSKTNINVEELLLLTEEGQTTNRVLKEKMEVLYAENGNLKDIVIELMDQIEIMYRGTSSIPDNPIARQIYKMWERMKESLPVAGITVIDKEKVPYHSKIHTVIETRQEEESEDYYVLDIVKCGYILADGEIRKAKVIVNKLNTASDQEAKHIGGHTWEE